MLGVDASLGRGSDCGGGGGLCADGELDGVCDGVGRDGRELDGVGGDGMRLGGDWLGEGRLGGLGGDGIDDGDGTEGDGIDGDGIGGMIGVWQPATVSAATTTAAAVNPTTTRAAARGDAGDRVAVSNSLAPTTMDVLLQTGLVCAGLTAMGNGGFAAAGRVGRRIVNE